MWARIPAPLHLSGGQAVNALNLAIRFFVVELGALAAAAYWGWEATTGPGRWYLAVLAPAAVILVWALFVSPKARIRVSKQAALAIELVLLGLVAVGLAVMEPIWVGIADGAVALVSGILNYAFEPYRTGAVA
jgi:hypothetical protein